MHDPKWSHAERAVARRAFDEALETALGKVMAEFKARAAAAQTPADLWSMEEYLREVRREIDWTFDYRYSRLLMVFALLIRQGYLDESRLAGLAEEKREIIRGLPGFDPATDRGGTQAEN